MSGRWSNHEENTRLKLESMSIPEPNSGCLLWIGRYSENGYGIVSFRGQKSAHRVSWTLANGPIPKDMFVCHKCDVPACINPAHLFLGTSLDNVQDRNKKGRTAFGSRVGGAKLTDEIVAKIHAEHAKGRGSRVLAREFGVHQSHIRRIFNRINWRKS